MYFSPSIATFLQDFQRLGAGVVPRVALAQLVGSLQGPIQKLAALLQAIVDKNGEAA